MIFLKCIARSNLQGRSEDFVIGRRGMIFPTRIENFPTTEISKFVFNFFIEQTERGSYLQLLTRNKLPIYPIIIATKQFI